MLKSLKHKVVSTVMFGSIFNAFRIVDYVVPTTRAFFLICHHYSKKVPVETESSVGGLAYSPSTESCIPLA